MIAHYATWKKLKKKKSLQPLIKKLLSVALAWVILPSSRSSVAKSVQYPSTLATSTRVCQRNNSV